MDITANVYNNTTNVLNPCFVDSEELPWFDCSTSLALSTSGTVEFSMITCFDNLNETKNSMQL